MGKFLIYLLLGAFNTGVSAEPMAPPFVHKVINEAIALYQPVAESFGAELKIELRLNSPSIVASAHRTDAEFRVVVDGGLINSSRLSEDGFRFVLCHELGHLFGGAPRRGLPPEWNGPVADDGLSFYSAEGQSDYYASAVCFRRLVQRQTTQEHQEMLKESNPPQVLINQCDRIWGESTNTSLTCQRAALGGLNMLLLVKDFDISFDKKSPERVSETIRDFYPSRQCRLDTALAGALCKSDLPLVLDFNDPLRETCENREGKRPGCWFNE